MIVKMDEIFHSIQPREKVCDRDNCASSSIPRNSHSPVSHFRIRVFIYLVMVSIILNLDAYSQIATSWAGGTGTVDDPYQISNITHLRKLAYDVNRGVSFKSTFFVMTNDIVDNQGVLNSDGTLASDNETLRDWIQIGSSKELSFKGCFDGNGHTISGICMKGELSNMTNEFASNAHIFGYVDNAIIKNLVIKDSYFSSMVGDALPGTVIENCINYGTTWSGFLDVGTTGEITIRKCGNYGLSYLVGIANRVFYGKIIDCYNIGTILGYESSDRSCGIGNYIGLCVNCVNYGKVFNDYKSAGLAYTLLAKDKDVVGLNLVNFGEVNPFNRSNSGAIACQPGYSGNPYNNNLKLKVDNAYALETSNSRLFANQAHFIGAGDQERMSEAEMKSQAFLDKLNANVDAINASRNLNCCHWKFGRDGFPILEIMDENAEASVEDMILSDNDSASSIYTLQGVKVNNPTDGIYIIVKNGKAKKIFLRGK